MSINGPYNNNRAQGPVVLQAPKSMAVAYILWFLIGTFGGHKFYLKQNSAGLVYLSLGLLGWALSFIFIGFLLLIPLYILMIVDLFTIPARVESLNTVY